MLRVNPCSCIIAIMQERTLAPASVDADDPDSGRPAWFAEFLAHRLTGKPSPHTVTAYRQDFDAIATILCDSDPAAMKLMPMTTLTKPSLREAFAVFAGTHAESSIRRCWSTWNVVCTYLAAAEHIPANPMVSVLRPGAPKRIPQAFTDSAVGRLIDYLVAQTDATVAEATEWPERDLAVIVTALVTGMRLSELIGANVGDLHVSPTANSGGVIVVHGKGKKDRSIPVETPLLEVLGTYVESRCGRLPDTVKRGTQQRHALARLRREDPLFVTAGGERITRGIIQYRVQRAYRAAGINSERSPGALVHQLRHTYATQLAGQHVDAYTLRKLLGHQSLAASQRYIDDSSIDTRPAAATNPVYRYIT